MRCRIWAECKADFRSLTFQLIANHPRLNASQSLFRINVMDGMKVF